MFSYEQYPNQITFCFHPCSVNDSNYKKFVKIGDGTFGEIFKAQDRKSLQQVAIKKISYWKDGFSCSTQREIEILTMLNHENVVKLIKVFQLRNITWLVLEFCDHDLERLLVNESIKFSLEQIKYVMKQLFNGLFYIHENCILHRDIKPANILINKEGIVKIADFGLSRAFGRDEVSDSSPLSPKVVTLWYRSPEIILGDRTYGSPIDLWSMGCIMGEFWTREAIFIANSPQKLLAVISDLCGSINPETWSAIEDLKHFKNIYLPQGLKRRVTEKFMPIIKDRFACDLLNKLLILDPCKRISAYGAMYHDFFYSEPMPQTIRPLLDLCNESMLGWVSQLEVG